MTTQEKNTFRAFIASNIVALLTLVASVLWVTYKGGTASASENSKQETEILNLKERVTYVETSINKQLNRNQIEHDNIMLKLNETNNLIIKLYEKK